MTNLKRHPFPDPSIEPSPWGVKYVCVMNAELTRLEAESNEAELLVEGLQSRVKELAFSHRTAQVSADDWRTMYEGQTNVLHDVRKDLESLHSQLAKANNECKRFEHLHTRAVEKQDQLNSTIAQLKDMVAELKDQLAQMSKAVVESQPAPPGVIGDNDGPWPVAHATEVEMPDPDPVFPKPPRKAN